MRLFNRKALKNINEIIDAAPPVPDPAPAPESGGVQNLTWNDLADIWNAGPTSSGVYVTPEGAMKISAVFACVRLISGIISTMPLQVFEKTGTGYDNEVQDHPLAYFFNERANPRESGSVLKRTTVANYLLDGNGLGQFVRTRGGEIIRVKSWAFNRVEVDWLNGEDYSGSGDDDEDIVYRYTSPRGVRRSFAPDDVMHFAGPGMGVLSGYYLRAPSPIRLAAGTVGVSVAAEDHAAEFFRNGARPGGVIQYPEVVDPTTIDKLREQWANRHEGKGNRQKPGILTEGGTWQDVGMSAEDAQLLQTRSWQVVDIARIYGVPPHLINEMAKSTAWGSGLTEQVKGFLLFTINEILKPFEQEISYKGFPMNSGLYAKYDRDSLTEGDIKTRMEAFKAALGGNQIPGHMTVNEVRKRQNMPPSEEDHANKLYQPVPGAKSEPETNEEPVEEPAE